MENRVQLAVSNDAQEVTHIVLDSGVWEVSGQVNFLLLSTPAGTMFTAANISVGTLSFNPPETASITPEQVGSPWQHNQKHFYGPPQTSSISR